MTRRDLRPHFLWDEDVSIGELQDVLAGPDSRGATSCERGSFLTGGAALAGFTSAIARRMIWKLRAYLADLIRRLLLRAAPEEPTRP